MVYSSVRLAPTVQDQHLQQEPVREPRRARPGASPGGWVAGRLRTQACRALQGRPFAAACTCACALRVCSQLLPKPLGVLWSASQWCCNRCTAGTRPHHQTGLQ
jgi:hypothetical protein